MIKAEAKISQHQCMLLFPRSSAWPNSVTNLAALG